MKKRTHIIVQWRNTLSFKKFKRIESPLWDANLDWSTLGEYFQVLHHHLIRCGVRTECGIVVETGEAREIHHFATLIGYGANAINPYLAFETIEDMRRRGLIDEKIFGEKAVENYIHAVGKGIYKVMSKMGISTVRSYTGAQIFEALGLSETVVERFFSGTPSRLGGIGLETIEEEALLNHHNAYPHEETEANDLEAGGTYYYREGGEGHLLRPEAIFMLQQSTRTNSYETYKKYATLINDQKEHGGDQTGQTRGNGET